MRSQDSAPEPGASASEGKAGRFPLRRADGAPLRVLIVEDEPFVALDLEAMIGDLGGAAAVAPTIAAARREVAATPPELVLMDIRLPDGDGVELASEIRGCGSAAVVFVTASTDPETLARIARLGPFEVVHKPVNTARLGQAVIAAVDGREG